VSSRLAVSPGAEFVGIVELQAGEQSPPSAGQHVHVGGEREHAVSSASTVAGGAGAGAPASGEDWCARATRRRRATGSAARRARGASGRFEVQPRQQRGLARR